MEDNRESTNEEISPDSEDAAVAIQAQLKTCGRYCEELDIE